MKKFADVNLSRKLILVLGGCVLLLAGLSILSLWGFHSIAKYELDTRHRMHQRFLVEAVARGVSEALIHVQVIADAKTDTRNEKAELQRVRKAYLAQLAEFKAAANTEQSRRHADQIEALVAEFIAINTGVLEMAANGHHEIAARQFDEKSLPTFRRVKERVDEADKWQTQLLEDDERRSSQVASAVWMAIAIGSVAAIILALGGGVLLSRSIASPLSTVISDLQAVAGGDLTHDTSSEFQARGDEIGKLAQAKQSMLVSLRQMVQDVSRGIQVLSASSAELSANSGNMSNE